MKSGVYVPHFFVCEFLEPLVWHNNMDGTEINKLELLHPYQELRGNP